MIFLNSLLILSNFIDIIYIQYSGKRSGWELIDMLFTSSDTLLLVPGYLTSYWYLFVLLLLVIAIQIQAFPRYKKYATTKFKNTFAHQLFAVLIALLLFGGGFIFARGLKSKPIRIISANDYVTPEYISLLLNTPFVISNTISQKKEGTTPFLPIEQAVQKYSPFHNSNINEEFKPMNVVILLLESFGKEYIESKSEDGKSFTPFLDSLFKEGLYCENAFANANRSIDALPPILAGFPSFLETAYISSAYSINKLNGLAGMLKQYQYSTSFFHGGHNGTMGFDFFSKCTGIDNYYGMTEYNNEKDFDGHWGIWDDKFLSFVADKQNEFTVPFFTTIFTLSSHEPYAIPKEYADKFFPHENKILRSVAYTDFALKEYFNKISKMSWYSNTLFVICPDHTSVVLDKKFQNAVNRISIPILYYCPSDSVLKGTYSSITQQLDIMPTVLDYLNYPKNYIAFGKSIFEPGSRYSITRNNGNYQIIDSSYCLLFDGVKPIFLANYRQDSTLGKNILIEENHIATDLEKNLRAYLQVYYYRLNFNLLADTVQFNVIK